MPGPTHPRDFKPAPKKAISYNAAVNTPPDTGASAYNPSLDNLRSLLLIRGIALLGQTGVLAYVLYASRTTEGLWGVTTSLAVLALEFQGLKLQAQVAEDAYKAALAAVEAARLDATRRLSTLVIVEPPTLPESAQYPRRLYGMATVLACCLLLYAIVRLTVATIREHQD